MHASWEMFDGFILMLYTSTPNYISDFGLMHQLDSLVFIKSPNEALILIHGIVFEEVSPQGPSTHKGLIEVGRLHKSL